MSTLGKGLLYFALVGALAALVAGYFVIQRSSTAQATIEESKQSLAAAKKQVGQLKEQADEANDAASKATNEATEAKAATDAANQKLAAATKEQDDLNAALTQAKSDADKAKSDLAHVNDVLGMTPDEAKAAMAKAQSDLAAANSQVKIFQDQLSADQNQIATLQDAVNREKVGTMPPGISGKITFVNRAWNFVVLNVGLSNGVVPNGELIVYRGRNFLGKVKVTSAESGTAVADILPNAKADIQVGDDVLN
jgi:cell division septum initiation protein DivIVA